MKITKTNGTEKTIMRQATRIKSKQIIEEQNTKKEELLQIVRELPEDEKILSCFIRYIIEMAKDYDKETEYI